MSASPGRERLSKRPAPSGGAPEPSVDDADAQVWRAVDLFRCCTLAYAVVVAAVRWEGYRRPAVAVAVLAAMTVWTAFLLVRRRRSAVLLAVDVAVAVAAVLLTAVADHPSRVNAGAPTLPTIWAATPVLAWAVLRGWRGGLGAAILVSGADLVEVRRLSQPTVNNIVLLLLAGAVVGQAVTVFRTGRRELAAAAAVEAAGRERERLAADIHDSVLQVLAYVQRRGTELGGEAGELGRLAGEQEVRLRTLVARAPGATPRPGMCDLRDLLAPLAGTDASLATPAEPVLLPGDVAGAVAEAAAEVLLNVRRHAGPGARAWMLVEDEEDAVTLTVRDDGCGFPPGRLDAARREGRLGVASAICGRIREVGGSARVVSAPGEGTEWELTVRR